MSGSLVVFQFLGLFPFVNLSPGGWRENHLSGPAGTLKLEQVIFSPAHAGSRWKQKTEMSSYLALTAPTVKSTLQCFTIWYWLVTVATVSGPTHTVASVSLGAGLNGRQKRKEL